MSPGGWRATVTTLVIAAAGGCTLEEITLVDPEDVVVGEVHVQLGERVSAFLHRTLTATGTSTPVPGARVTVRRTDGLTLELAETTLDRCVVTIPVDGTGTCHFASRVAVQSLRPGDTLTLRIDLPDGGVMESQSVIPGTFFILGIGDLCSLPPATPLPVSWTASDGAWAYINEALLENVIPSYAPLGIVVDPTDDPLYLLGLSVSAADTSIVFPGEFGLFNRFELDQALAISLQGGLPDGLFADVSITAADRNYVNWVRGGNFNPSGQVRVPSIRGDGTGVFASTVARRFRVVAASTPPPGVPTCPTT